LRAAKTSKKVSAAAVLGLIVVSTIMAILFNTSLSIVEIPHQVTVSGGQGTSATGVLLVQLVTNENETGAFSEPTNYLSPIASKSFNVTLEGNTSTPFSQVLVTDAARGVAFSVLPPGLYDIKVAERTVVTKIPVSVTAGNTTDVTVTFSEAAYPLAYSEEYGATLTPTGIQSNIFAELQSGTPVANVSEPVILDVHAGFPLKESLVNATVVGGKPPAEGTEWLELQTAGTVDTVNATSVFLTTWSYSSEALVTPGVTTGGAFD